MSDPALSYQHCLVLVLFALFPGNGGASHTFCLVWKVSSERCHNYFEVFPSSIFHRNFRKKCMWPIKCWASHALLSSRAFNCRPVLHCPRQWWYNSQGTSSTCSVLNLHWSFFSADSTACACLPKEKVQQILRICVALCSLIPNVSFSTTKKVTAHWLSRELYQLAESSAPRCQNVDRSSTSGHCCTALCDWMCAAFQFRKFELCTRCMWILRKIPGRIGNLSEQLKTWLKFKICSPWLLLEEIIKNTISHTCTKQRQQRKKSLWI